MKQLFVLFLLVACSPDSGMTSREQVGQNINAAKKAGSDTESDTVKHRAASPRKEAPHRPGEWNR